MSVVMRARWLIPRRRGGSVDAIRPSVGPASGFGDGAALRSCGKARVLGQDAGRVAGLGELPLGAAARQLGVIHGQVDRLGGAVEDDPVAVGEERGGGAGGG